MPKISLSPTFLKEILMIFRQRPLKDIMLGKKISLQSTEKNLLTWIKKNPANFQQAGGLSGKFIKIELFHRARGDVFLLSSQQGKSTKQSLVVFDDNFSVTPGPDLYVYLSTESKITKGQLGEYLDLGLIKGTKGGQAYIINQPIQDLKKYKSVVIWCKQFEILFSYATLN